MSISDFLMLLAATFYLMLPGIFADMAPVMVRHVFSNLAKPIDFGKKLWGKRILGDHKTFRGLLFGVLMGIIVANLQGVLFKNGIFTTIALVDYASINLTLFGALLGFGVICGDAIKSFFKRRCNIPPGKPFMPWDQIDSVTGAFVFMCILYVPPLPNIITGFLLAFFLHLIIPYAAFHLGLRKEKW